MGEARESLGDFFRASNYLDSVSFLTTTYLHNFHKTTVLINY